MAAIDQRLRGWAKANQAIGGPQGNSNAEGSTGNPVFRAGRRKKGRPRERVALNTASRKRPVCLV